MAQADAQQLVPQSPEPEPSTINKPKPGITPRLKPQVILLREVPSAANRKRALQLSTAADRIAFTPSTRSRAAFSRKPTTRKPFWC